MLQGWDGGGWLVWDGVGVGSRGGGYSGLLATEFHVLPLTFMQWAFTYLIAASIPWAALHLSLQ